jgi:hypothetical protein
MRDFLEELQKAHRPFSGSAFGESVRHEFAGFEVLLTAVKITIFWGVTLCIPLEVH